MRIALDATYSIDRYPSGVAIYSREILFGLAAQYPADQFLYCYRPKQFRYSTANSSSNVKRRLLLPSIPTFHAGLFHALNQRVDRRPAKRVVTTFHDLFVLTAEYSSPEFRKRFTAQARRAVEQSDYIIAVSKFTAAQVRDLLGVEGARIRVIPHGVHVPQQQGSPTREKMILFVGALQVRKNIIRLVEAFETLPEDWSLVLAGSARGYGAEQILDRIRASERRDRIRIAGYVSSHELEQLYSRASIFAFPSLDEGFGIPILEAMAHSIPVLTSNRSALIEVADNAAITVDPYRTEEIASSLQKLVSDESLRDRLATQGRLRAARFTWQDSVRATYRIYQELLS